MMDKTNSPTTDRIQWNVYTNLTNLVGKHVNIHIAYYTGWSFNFTQRHCTHVEKDVHGILHHLPTGTTVTPSPTGCTQGWVIVCDSAQMFSWGNGPTLPRTSFLLYADGSMGYHEGNNTFQIWTSQAPTWSLFET